MSQEPASPAHQLAAEAVRLAQIALDKANEALERCDRTEASVAGLGHVVNRCTNEVLEIKRINDQHHTETMAAIEGAKRADAARRQQDSVHEEKITRLENRLTAVDIAKITVAGGGGSALVALVIGVLTLLLGRPVPPQTAPALAPIPALVAPAPGATP